MDAARFARMVLVLVAAVLVALAGCTSSEKAAPEPAAEESGEGEAGGEESAAVQAPEPVREELAVSLTAHGRARYTLALNKTTGVTMEQTHVTPSRTVVFPAGKTSVARFEFADGRAVEMAVQRPHRLDGGEVRFDGCVLRMNWTLGSEGRMTAPCGEFVGREGPRSLLVHESLDESVALVVEASSEGVRGEASEAEAVADESFATGAWQSDGGAWVFVPSGLSVESVVRRREASPP